MGKRWKLKGRIVKLSLVLMLAAGMVFTFYGKLGVKADSSGIQANVENNAKKIIETGNPVVLQNGTTISPDDLNAGTATVYATPAKETREIYTYFITIPKTGILQFSSYSTDVGSAITDYEGSYYNLYIKKSSSSAFEDMTYTSLYQQFNTAAGVKNAYHIMDAGVTVKMILRVNKPHILNSTNQVKFTMRLAPAEIKTLTSADAGKTFYIGPQGFLSGQHIGDVSVNASQKGTITLEISDVSGLKSAINIDSDDCKKQSINYGTGTATAKFSTGPGTKRFTTRTSAPICSVKMYFTPDNSPAASGRDPYIPLGAATLDKSGKKAAALPHKREMKGSTFYKLKARAVRTTRTTNKLQWQKVAGATGYAIFGCKCGGSHKFKLLKKTKSLSWKQRNLKRATHYKYLVMAYRKNKSGRYVIAISKTIHITTRENKTCTMAKSIQVSKKSVTLKKGKTYKLKAKEIPINPKKKINHHRKLCFESNNKLVATVSEHGKIRAKGTGECKIYVYSQNGVYKSVKIKVK